MSQTREGSCLCGSVRYEVDWPLAALVVCHCTHCQKQAGSAFSLVGVTAREGLHLTGELKTYEDSGTTGQTVYRQFCPQCGSPVLTDTPAAREQGIIFLKAGTLDSTEGLEPSLHYWCDSAHDWFAIPDGVQKLAKQ